MKSELTDLMEKYNIIFEKIKNEISLTNDVIDLLRNKLEIQINIQKLI